jgi:hypothetical protein
MQRAIDVVQRHEAAVDDEKEIQKGIESDPPLNR